MNPCIKTNKKAIHSFPGCNEFKLQLGAQEGFNLHVFIQAIG